MSYLRSLEGLIARKCQNRLVFSKLLAAGPENLGLVFYRTFGFAWGLRYEQRIFALCTSDPLTGVVSADAYLLIAVGTAEFDNIRLPAICSRDRLGNAGRRLAFRTANTLSRVMLGSSYFVITIAAGELYSVRHNRSQMRIACSIPPRWTIQSAATTLFKQ